MGLLAGIDNESGYRRGYKCAGRMYGKTDCRMRSIPAENVEHAVWKEIVGLVTNPGALDKAVRIKNYRETDKQAVIRIKENEKQLDILATEEKRLVSAYKRGLINDEQLYRQVNEIQANRERFSEEIKKLNYPDTDNENWASSLRIFKQYLAKTSKHIDHLEFEEKRNLLDLFVDKITVFKDGGIQIFCSLPKIAEIEQGKRGRQNKQLKTEQYRPAFILKTKIAYHPVTPCLKPRKWTNYFFVSTSLSTDMVKKLKQTAKAQNTIVPALVRKGIDLFLPQLSQSGKEDYLLTKQQKNVPFRTSFAFTKQQKIELTKAKNRTGINISELVRQAINKMLAIPGNSQSNEDIAI